MKKTLISLLLVLALVLCFALVAAPTAHAVNTEHADSDHCICGGTSSGVNGHVCADVDDWQEWNKANELPKETGKYWLSTNVTLTAAHTLDENANIVICLNGNKIEASEGRVVTIEKSSLTICDCSKVQTTDGYTYSGTVECTTTGMSGGVFRANANGTLTVYGGNIVAPESAAGACAYSNAGTATINIYGGNFTGNTVSGNGGCFYIDKAALNIYGGTFSGGSASNGGAIYVKSSSGSSAPGKLKIAGGVIKNCSAAKGGAVYVDQKDNQVEISGGKIMNCSATNQGGAVYVFALRNKLTISGGEIVGCTANEGDAVYGGAPQQASYANTYNFTGGKIVSGKNGGNVIVLGNDSVSLAITKMGLEIDADGKVGVGYATEYTVTDGMKAKLTVDGLQSTAYGLRLQLAGGEAKYYGKNDQNAEASSYYLYNIMNGGSEDAARAALKVEGAAYAVIGGTVVESAPQSFSLQTLIEKMDSKLDDAYLEILADLYKLYQPAMEGWTIPNIKTKAA